MPKNRIPADVSADKTRSFLARYGATVLRGGIAAIPTALFTYQARLDLSPQEVWFISYILAHKWDEDLPYPSLRKMAERTGLSVRQLHRIKDAVVEKGYLQLVPRRRSEDGGQDSNAYDFGGLFGRIEELLRADGRLVEARQEAPYSDTSSEPPPMRSVAAPAAPPSRQVKTRTAPPPSMSSGPVTLTTPGRATRESAPPVTQKTSRAVTATSPAPVSSVTETAATAPTVDPVAHESYKKSPPLKTEKNPSEQVDSNRFSAYIMAVASDLSRELGDSTHEVANMTQANRLWQESGLDETAFVVLMQEARQRTRRAQGGQGSGLIDNRAAYFFHVVRQLVAALSER